ncbi:glutamate receptor ionotropic, delta-1-like [Amphibalanus amphitrite]|uniref:glutamate receptor ionotropic, delta-1-like n=1 Tax=Amphibalanus amphitrite TaxID=1232801 RepID=UPI001C9128E1|nr:glutamate receptor ionotropic, delta-1-like [Amphibalanus amphitrite]
MQAIGQLMSVGRTWSVEPFSGEGMTEPLRVVAFHDPPYISVVRQGDGSYHFDGYLMDLWHTIARELRLTYRLVALPGGGYGSMDENGTWNGLIGELAYGRADVALTWANLRQDRAQAVDYLAAVPVDQYQNTFHVRQGTGAVPQITPGMFSSLLKPLHMNVWWSLLASMFVVSWVLRIALRYNHERAERRETVADMTWGTCFLSSFMSVVGQGWASTPDSLAARTATIFSWVLGILIYVNYTANLISYLTVTTVDKPISSLKEFSEQSGWKFALERGIGTLNDWKVSSSPYERELFRRVSQRDGYLELDGSDEAFRKSIEPNVLVYIDVKRLLFTLGDNACITVPLLDRLPAKANAYIVMAKGRERLHSAINQVMRVMNQAGTISRLKARWLPGGQDMCAAPASGGFKELSLGDVLAVLVLVPLGIICSVGLSMLEWLWAKCQ